VSFGVLRIAFGCLWVPNFRCFANSRVRELWGMTAESVDRRRGAGRRRLGASRLVRCRCSRPGGVVGHFFPGVLRMSCLKRRCPVENAKNDSGCDRCRSCGDGGGCQGVATSRSGPGGVLPPRRWLSPWGGIPPRVRPSRPVTAIAVDTTAGCVIIRVWAQVGCGHQRNAGPPWMRAAARPVTWPIPDLGGIGPRRCWHSDGDGAPRAAWSGPCPGPRARHR